MKHPPGVIGASLGDIVRYAEFIVSLQRTWRPRGTTTSLAQSVSIPENMNRIIRQLPAKAQWLWIQADDHIWAPDALRKLLDRQVDVVVPLIVRRAPPFVPVINKKRTRQRSYLVFPYKEIPTEGMLEIPVAAGTAGMLIRRHVLDRIQELQGHDRVFEVEAGDKLAEDYVLCGKILKAGFKIWCDTEVTMGHQGRFAVWPEPYEGRWRLRFDMGRSPDGRPAHFFYDTQDQPE